MNTSRTHDISRALKSLHGVLSCADREYEYSYVPVPLAAGTASGSQSAVLHRRAQREVDVSSVPLHPHGPCSTLRDADMALVQAANPKHEALDDDGVQVFRVSGGVAQPDTRSSLDIEAQTRPVGAPAPRVAPVISLPVQMQHGFVRKSLGLLVMQPFAELAAVAGPPFR